MDDLLLPSGLVLPPPPVTKRRAKKKEPANKGTAAYYRYREKNTKAAKAYRDLKRQEKCDRTARLAAAKARQTILRAEVAKLEAELEKLAAEDENRLRSTIDFGGPCLFPADSPMWELGIEF